MEWILEWRADWLTPIMKAATALGDEPFFLVSLPVGFWLWRRGAFARIGWLFFFTVVANAALKEIFQAPRPMIEPLVPADGYSFPSGHAMISAAFWGGLAVEVGRRWFWPVAVFVIALVMSSRVYLGVHWPHDVAVGALVGALIVAASVALRRAEVPAALRAHGAVIAWSPVLLVVGVALLLQDPEDTGLKSASTLAGFWAGVLMADGARLPELPGRSAGAKAVWSRVVALVLGLAVLVAIWAGGKRLLVAADAYNVVTASLRYLLMGLWVGVGAPWLFHRIGLTHPVDPPADAA